MPTAGTPITPIRLRDLRAPIQRIAKRERVDVSQCIRDLLREHPKVTAELAKDTTDNDRR